MLSPVMCFTIAFKDFKLSSVTGLEPVSVILGLGVFKRDIAHTTHFSFSLDELPNIMAWSFFHSIFPKRFFVKKNIPLHHFGLHKKPQSNDDCHLVVEDWCWR